MNFIEEIDRITIEQLRQTGATKWTAQDDMIGAFVAEMDFGVAPEIQRALHESVDQGLFGYLPQHFVADLQSATSKMLQNRYGWTISNSDVRPVPDVIKALEMAIKHHSRPGSKIIVPTPAYMPFLSLPPAMDRDIIEVPMKQEDGQYSLDLDAIQRAFDDGGNLLILCNPFNPVGRVFTQQELADLADVINRNDGRVFADEIWAPLVYAGHKHIPYASVNSIAAGHSVTAISASKAWNLPGLKCAQVITSNDADRAIWDKIGFFAGHGTGNLGVISNIAAYRHGFSWLGNVLDVLDRNRQALTDLVATHLPGVRYVQPEGSYIGWLDCRDTPVARAPAKFFKEKAKVHLTDGASCGAGFDGFVRFIFATPLPILEEAIKRMGDAMRNARPEDFSDLDQPAV